MYSTFFSGTGTQKLVEYIGLLAIDKIKAEADLEEVKAELKGTKAKLEMLTEECAKNNVCADDRGDCQ